MTLELIFDFSSILIKNCEDITNLLITFTFYNYSLKITCIWVKFKQISFSTLSEKYSRHF